MLGKAGRGSYEGEMKWTSTRFGGGGLDYAIARMEPPAPLLLRPHKTLRPPGAPIHQPNGLFLQRGAGSFAGIRPSS
jgi:hypothetical protein